MVALMGDELPWEPGLTLLGAASAVCRWRVFRNGTLAHEAHGDALRWTPPGPGVYRAEAWVRLDEEDRPWIYSNPIYLR
jgi:hypothetical protein